MAELNNNTEQVFVCSGRPKVEVDVTRGSLFVRGWDGAEVRIEDDSACKIRHRGDTVRIESSRSCALRLYLPRASDLFIDGTSLEIDLGGIRGFTSIDVTNSPVRIEDWQGDIEIDGTDCPVRLFQCNGQAGIDTAGGAVEILSSQGSFNIDTGSGPVAVQDSAGSLAVDTGGGGVDLAQFRGPVHIDTGSGSVELRGVSSRNVYVDCGRGNIAAVLPGASPGQWQLETGSGTVTLQVPANISASFEFEAPELEVDDLALEGAGLEEGRITGRLNDGQGRVSVFSSTGRIIGRKIPIAFTLDTEPDQDECLKILIMLEEGTISTAEAEQLLDALKGGDEDE